MEEYNKKEESEPIQHSSGLTGKPGGAEPSGPSPEQMPQEELLSTFLDALPVGVHLYELRKDNSLVFIGANRDADRILGLDNRQFVGKTIEEAFPSLADTRVPENYRMVALTGERWQQEQFFYQDNRIEGAFDVHAVRLAPGRIAVAFIDVTAHIRVQEELRNEKAAYQRLIESIEQGHFIYSHDCKGVFTYLSPSITKILGYREDEFKKHYTAHLTDNPENAKAVRHTDLSLQGRKQPPYTVEIFHKDGSIRWLEVVEVPVFDHAGQVIAVEGIAHDITSRKKADEALRQNEQRFAQMNDALPVAVYEADTNGRLTYVNATGFEMFGYTLAEFNAGINIMQTIIPEERDLAQTRFLELLQGRETYFREYSALRKDGSTFPVIISSRPIIHDGAVTGIRGIVTDITDRKRAEDELKKSEASYRDIFNATTVSLWEEDHQEVKRELSRLRGQGISDIRAYLDQHPEFLQQAVRMLKVISVNDATLRLYKAADREELIRSLDKVFVPETSVALTEVLMAIAEGRRHVEVETVNRTLAGEKINILLAVTIPDLADDTTPLLVSILDITERKRLAAEHQKMEKLESLGILAGGIAHDFNNLLTAILGNISLAEASVNSLETREILLNAEKACLRARNLTQQLMSFSRGGQPIKTPVSYARVIEDTTLFSLRGSATRCVFRLSHDLWPGIADEGQISQVISNLVINADQAMSGSGQITIEAENIVISNTESLPLQPGNYVKISVIDQGPGIPRENLAKIIDPYFTTKENGSGLGLSVVYSIVRNHGGHLTVHSQQGRGATFAVYLPASPGVVPGDPSERQKQHPGSGRILVMDDEETVRNVTAEILKSLGYEVTTAHDGAEALELYTRAMKTNTPYDVVIMDLTIVGGMGGKEAVQRLIDIDPTVRAIVSSGYSNDPVMSHFRDYGFSECIAKPYRSADLAALLRRMLDQST